MKRTLILALLCAFFSCKKQSDSLSTSVFSNNTVDGVVETSPPTHIAKYVQINSNVTGYMETLPSLYYKTTKSYPLIVFLHGVGELASSKGLTGLNCCGLPYHAARQTFPASFAAPDGSRHSFIAISPQFRVRANADQIQSVVNYAKTKYRVDPTRVYVTGLSLGGGMTWDYSVLHGQNAAAIVPVCGGTKPTTTLAQQVASKNLPIWGIYSYADEYIPEQWGIDWFKWIDAANPTIAPKTKLTIRTSDTHIGIWKYAYNPVNRIDGKNIYEWMLSYRRSSINMPPVAKVSNDFTVSLSSGWIPVVYATYSYDTDGWIAAFKWTKVSGASCVIETPTSAKTRISGLAAGTYVFRAAVTDNKGAVSYDDVKIVVTN
jgi:pimeloyl-ACP methyl ester carboxylesterase